MEAVYILEGSTGEYSDRTEWQVAAYESEQDAIAKATELNTLARVVFADGEYYNLPQTHAICKLDPEFYMTYTGTDYTVYPVKLIYKGESK